MTDEARPPASTDDCDCYILMRSEHFASCRPSLPAAAAPQPLPTGNGQPVLELVIADLRARSAVGVRKYGTVLRTFNGRDADLDAYQEALDDIVYRKQAMLEREDLRARVRELELLVSHVIASRGLSKAVTSGFGTEEQAKEADTISENLELALAKFKPSGSVIEELADAIPGRELRVEKRGHTFAVTATTQTGIHTGRRRYRVECETCGTLVHEATTGPDQNIEYHLREVEPKCVQQSDFHEKAQHAFGRICAGERCACGAKIIDSNGNVVDKIKAAIAEPEPEPEHEPDWNGALALLQKWCDDRRYLIDCRARARCYVFFCRYMYAELPYGERLLFDGVSWHPAERAKF